MSNLTCFKFVFGSAFHELDEDIWETTRTIGDSQKGETSVSLNADL